MKLELLDHKELETYPSASGIEYFDGHIYISGDDAKTILVTNTRWKKSEEIPLFESEDARIPKLEKADLEASAVIELEGKPYLLILGSGSRELRNKAVLYDLLDKIISVRDLSVFFGRIKEAGITDLNIEGAAQINKKLVLCNRGHKSNPANQFIVTSYDFFRNQSAAPIEILPIKRPPMKGTVGVSGLCYSERHDSLLFTTSTEDTNNSFDDGTIGNSYLGIIENAGWKMGRGKIKVNDVIDLTAADKAFKGFKIESVCIQSSKKGSMKIHMVADNDEGKSHLFKAIVKIS